VTGASFLINRKESMKTNIEIPVADLKNVLPGLSKIVGRKSSLPVLSCVKVTHNPDQTVCIQANNLDQIVTVRLNKPVNGPPGELLVPLEELSAMAKKCAANDTIELSVDGKETFITYPAAGTRIKKPLTHVGLDEFPPETVVNTEPIRLDDAFKEALQHAFGCASVDQSRYVLNGACLDVGRKEAHYVVGTDGRHLFSANSFLFDIPQSVIVPQGKFLTWPGFIEDGPWTLRFQPPVKGETKNGDKPAWVRLDSDHWTYVSKPIEGEYPNWRQVVPGEASFKSHITLGEPGIKIILDALPLLPGQEDRDQPVSLEIKGEYLNLKAKGNAAEWTEIPIPAKVSGIPVNVTMNRTYLAKALKFGLAQVEIEDSVSPLVFSAKGKMLVVCPLGPPKPAKSTPAPSTPPPLNASAATTPQPAEPITTAKPERTNPVPENTMTAPQRGNLTGHSAETDANNSAIDEMIEQIGTVKTGLREVFDGLQETEKLLRKAQKEHKATEKEIGRARSALRSLQSVEI
jgi:DNA polymerase III sliding clamp (beta) subunit (PCNA family)